MKSGRVAIECFVSTISIAALGCGGRALGLRAPDGGQIDGQAVPGQSGGQPGGRAMVGQICDLTVEAEPSQAIANMMSGTCPFGVCLKPVVDPSRALLEPPLGATCTAACSSDSDCTGETRDPNDPQDARCQGGFVCGVPFVVGPLCCKRYCVCRDFLGADVTQTPPACMAADALATCQRAAGNAVVSPVEEESDSYLTPAPIRKLDLVFMIDNSPSMAPKVSKLKQQFPKLIDAFKDPSDGSYPDLRIAIMDSDLGTGGAYSTGSCGPNASNGQSIFGDLGNFQVRGAAACGMTDKDALWIEYTNGRPVNFSRTVDISQVLACLAGGLGSAGCGEEHPLQALEFGLVEQSLDQDQKVGLQNAFLRPEAYLGLVILSDEDDCSAATNDGMFGSKPQLAGESTSLRCATRAHQCNGVNLSSPPPGFPASASFETDFTNCGARIDACPNPTDGTSATDTSGATACSPLKDIHHLAEEIKALKVNPDEQIMVAGIFGWPRMLLDAAGLPVLDSDGRVQPDMSSATYRIDVVPGPGPEDIDGQHGPIWDLWPVCYDRDHQPKTPDAYDADAWGWGARPGLRLSAFIDEFGDNGFKFSICERDFFGAMGILGRVPVKTLHNLCVDAKLVDVDPVTPGLQSDCRVVYRTPQADAKTGQTTYVENPQSLPMCSPGASPEGITSDCWQITYDTAKCPSTGQLISVVRTAAEIASGPLAEGTKTGVQCWTCPDLVSTPGCDY